MLIDIGIDIDIDIVIIVTLFLALNRLIGNQSISEFSFHEHKQYLNGAFVTLVCNELNQVGYYQH